MAVVVKKALPKIHGKHARQKLKYCPVSGMTVLILSQKRCYLKLYTLKNY